MIKVSYLLSYDYMYFLTSVKQLYNDVDKIIVAIDKDYKTWSGNTFEIPNSFFEEVKAFDSRNIIEFYFEKFYIEGLSPINCESRERNMVLKKLGRGWKIQLDVDEYIYEFKEIKKYLDKYWYLTLFPKFTPVCIQGILVTLYKEFPEGYLFINNGELFSFITNQKFNIHTRWNDKVRNHNACIRVIHQSWARPANEIEKKIKNWGHKDDFEIDKYFDFWKKIDIINYINYINIHPIVPEVWNKLNFVSAISIDDFIDRFSKDNHQVLLDLPIFKIIKLALKKILGRH